jgi:hypothetical protein
MKLRILKVLRFNIFVESIFTLKIVKLYYFANVIIIFTWSHTQKSSTQFPPVLCPTSMRNDETGKKCNQTPHCLWGVNWSTGGSCVSSSHLFVHLSVCPFVQRSFLLALFVHMSVCPTDFQVSFVHPCFGVRRSVASFWDRSVFLSLCPYVCLSDRLSV